MRKENKEFLTYITKYLGVALIAGSVVHIGTLDNGTIRYFILAVIGLALMLIGNLVEAKQLNQKINLKFFATVIALSFATGFLSGGVQHYLDNPVYASYLLAIGLFVSYIAFFVKDKIELSRKSIVVVALMSLVLLFSHYLLDAVLMGHIDFGSDSHTH